MVKVDIHKAGYDQGEPVIRQVHFQINQGELVGLIGPNGAGKSTTIKALLGTIGFVEGQVQFNDTYAYIPEQPVYYDELTLWEHIQFTASICELSEEEMNRRVKPLLNIFRLKKMSYINIRHHSLKVCSRN